MTVDVLVLCPDGTQHLEHREVPDDFYSRPLRENAGESQEPAK